MKDKIFESFLRYTKIVQSVFCEENKNIKEEKTLRLFKNKKILLKSLVDELENRDEFKQLLLQTNKIKYGMKDYLRQSGYYIDIFEGRKIDINEIFDNLIKHLNIKERQYMHLIPMEYVEFEYDHMSFDSFEIKRFSEEELNSILRNEVNEIFYSWAAIDVKQIEDYWFIYMKSSSYISLRAKPLIGSWPTMAYRAIEYTKYSKPLEIVFQKLALYDWQGVPSLVGHSFKSEGIERYLEKPWFGFHVPFIISVKEDLFYPPFSSEGISAPEKMPIYNDAGEEIEEVPYIATNLNKDETERFKVLVHRMENLLGNLQNRDDKWKFLDVALEFFVKAFFTEGPEQLLWHITALESLLGEKRDIQDTLARRVALILGKSEKERETIRKHFRKIYDFRSELVHGTEFKKKLHKGHLNFARNVTRLVFLWFINFLYNIQSIIDQDEESKIIPTRKDILILIDMDDSARDLFSHIANKLPTGFPYVQEWKD